MHRFLPLLILTAAPAMAEPVATSGCRFSADPPPDMLAVDCEVTNTTPIAIATLEFELAVFETGRAVPWTKRHSGTFIPGGIEPGETATVTFPVMADPETVDRLADFSPKVEILTALDVGGKPIP